MFAKSQHLDGHTVPGDLLQRQFERLPVGRSHQYARQPLAAAQRDVVEHVAVDVAVLVDLRFREDREAHVTQRLHPWANDVGATCGDVGEDGRLGLQRDLRALGGQLRRAGQQPPAEGVEPWPVRGGGPAAEDRTEAHVQIGRAPDQQHPRRRLCRLHRRWGCFFYVTDVFGQAHGRFSQSNSATALPACWALPSYLVTGRCTEIGSVSDAATRRSRGSASPTSAICSAYPAWSVAACNTPPVSSRSAISATVAGCSSRRLWWRAFGQGSGKNSRTPVSESGPNMCSSTSTPSPRTSRTLVMPSRSMALSSWASPRR